MHGKPLKPLLITKNNFCVRTTIQSQNRSSIDLQEDLVKEVNRVKELLRLYHALPDNIGLIAAQRLKIHLAHAEKAIQDKDIIQMLQIYGILKECQ
jgi:hypothetical protein